MIRAISFDYWDTLYDGGTLAERKRYRQDALRRMLADLGHASTDADFESLYHASGQEAERWWREEHRGYHAEERIRWMLARVGIERPDGCEHIAEAVRHVDRALVEMPPPLLPGAAHAIRALAQRLPLAIISDTGFASGTAQDALLEQDGMKQHFAARIYSCDVGHAKPRAEMFLAAAEALDLKPRDMLHVGDIERTDIRGALAVGMRAVRVDIVRASGPSAAEFVAPDYARLLDYLEKEAAK